MGFKLPALGGKLGAIVSGKVKNIVNTIKNEPEDLLIPQKLQNMLPINARAFAGDIIGNITGIDSFKSEINERHLSDEEKL